MTYFVFTSILSTNKVLDFCVILVSSTAVKITSKGNKLALSRLSFSGGHKLVGATKAPQITSLYRQHLEVHFEPSLEIS